jgi:hypothetical protein
MRALWFALFSLGAMIELSLGAQPMSDAQVREAIIADSIVRYSGACPCPYNIMRNGRRCGGNSAYSKPGGASPICYPQDVTPAMIETFRRQLASK